MRFTAVLTLLMGFTAFAQDGVVLINQDLANAGGITSGDAPGFPITITEPGSYKLTSNLRVLKVDTDAIQILVDNVTLDLNGFTIFGPRQGRGLGVNGWANFLSFPSGYTSVRNGNVTGFSEGLFLGYNATVQKIRASFNSKNGIHVLGFSLVEENNADFNDVGILGTSGPGGVYKNNITVNNKTWGLGVPCPATIIGNASAQNAVADIFPFNPATGTPSTACTRANNSPLP